MNIPLQGILINQPAQVMVPPWLWVEWPSWWQLPGKRCAEFGKRRDFGWGGY